jgi:hypothetical protein
MERRASTDLSPLLLVGSGPFLDGRERQHGAGRHLSAVVHRRATTSLMNALTNRTCIMMTPDTASTAATFAGNTVTLSGPTLVFEATPEPGSVLLAVVAAAGLASWRRGRARGVCASA